ncbi:MAG TPA: tripartite tricarboxylate transporter substrate-binding protein [Burkholderiales bacterium]|nr:tripartite tricarboxylate transporter substrate-binding protein [Burkholderiales bacterium]
MFPTMSAALPLVRSGRLKAYALTSASRSPLAPEIPTVAESGVPGYEAATWFGVMVPKATSPAITARLNGVFTAVLRVPDIRERLTNQGFDTVGSTAADFAGYIKVEILKWAKVAKTSGASVD